MATTIEKAIPGKSKVLYNPAIIIDPIEYAIKLAINGVFVSSQENNVFKLSSSNEEKIIPNVMIYKILATD